MYLITRQETFTENIFLLEVEAPRVAANCLPGQFVVVRISEEGERIPLTICDYDSEKGTVVLVVQTIGKTSYEMAGLKKGEYLLDIAGPLGNPSELTEMSIDELKNKSILFVAGGLGAAPVYPQVKWLHEHGIDADVIMGAKNKDFVILEEEMKAVAGNLYITTDDGSYGRSGLVTKVIDDLMADGNKYDICVAIGPMIMMKFACLTTKKYGIYTIVSMNPIMVDGTGMCGACRVSVGGEIKFACVDGPEFDGHKIDFDEAMRRQLVYKTEEGRSLLKLQEKETHHGGCGYCGGDK